MYKRLAIVFFFVYLLFPTAIFGSEYKLEWPGILPDNPLYKVKVLRNKIIYKLIYSPIKRVEFDLLMANKTLYASQLLFNKGEIDLAKETALKGENYMSLLVSDNVVVLSKKQHIPEVLDRKIKSAFIAHRKLLDDLISKSTGEDKKIFTQVQYFLKVNKEAYENPKRP